MRLSIFLLFLALFALTTSGHIYTIDSYLNFAVTDAIGSRGTLEIPRFMMTVEGTGGHHYSKLGIGQSIAGLPLYWLGCFAERVGPGHPAFRAYSKTFTVPHEAGPITGEPQTLVRVSDKEGARVFFTTLTNALVMAAVCVVFWGLLKDFGLSRPGALWGTLLVAFATPLWIYSRDLFAEPMFALSLLGTFRLLHDPTGIDEANSGQASHRVAVAGALSCLGILARLSYLPIVALFAVYIVVTSRDKAAGVRRALRYGLYCLPALVVIALLNLRRFGGVTLTGYHTAFDKGFSVPLADGLRWNLLSPYRSIFLYAPPVALFFVGLKRFAHRYRAQLILVTSIVLLMLIMYSKWWAWHGGWCWGPRFLVPIMPLMIVPGLAVMDRYRKWLLPVGIALGVLGFCCQLGGITVNYTAIYDFWIKTGRLDWAEAGIHTFSPVPTHIKAMLATHPRHYDLWIIQACQAGRAVCVVTLLIITFAIGFALRRLARCWQTCE
jgi:hypothetical protein